MFHFIEGPKVFATSGGGVVGGRQFDGYSEETLALAIVMTAFVALLIGLCLGIFVTRQCTNASEKRDIKSPAADSSMDEIHKYSVTTLSSYDKNDRQSNEFNQISYAAENSHHQPISLPPQFSRHSIASTSSQPLSLNPRNLEQQQR